MSTPDELKTALAGIHRQAARAEGAGKNLVDAARQRRDQVTERLTSLQGQALSDTQAADEYKALLHERGQLDLVIANG